MQTFWSSFPFLFVTGVIFFLPGFVLLRAYFGKRNFTQLETFVFSFAVSLVYCNLLLLLMGKMGILFTPMSLLLSIGLGLAFLSSLPLLFKRFIRSSSTPQASEKNAEKTERLLFSRREGTLFLFLLVLTVLIKTIYLSDAVLPTSTDLGHHMYWSKLIVETGELPYYAKQEIITNENDVYELADPKPISDFIIGEHLPFAAISILSGTSFFSAFPVTFLSLINLISLLALVLFAFRLATGLKGHSILPRLFSPAHVALATLFLFGPLYTLASPQAKFVSGGVVGNTLGNLFIPLILLAFYRAFREKRGDFFALGIVLAFGLAYIHHLSTLILAFILLASGVAYIAFNYSKLASSLREWWKLVWTPGTLIVLVAALLFFLTVAMPTYIETEAVGTAIGSPTKTTRTGLSFLQVSNSSGEARVALGLSGLLFLLATPLRKRYASAFLMGWALILLIMTMRPHWLFIDIPSSRIGAYLSFPLGILASLALVFFLSSIYGKYEKEKKLFLPLLAVSLITLGLFSFTLGSGGVDNSRTLLSGSKALSALETFQASEYLAEHNKPTDVILKDHNYIAADAWIKLFFLRDYFYPLSRGFFKRYEDNPNREQCTLLMISVPNTARGEKCYTETGTNLVMVNPEFDTAQFEKSERFSRIYASEGVDIYYRAK